MTRRLGLGLALSIALAACESTPTDIDGLADQAPTTYSVLVTGGAFVDSSGIEGEGPLASTFGTGEPGEEAIPLDGIVDALRRARAFVTVEGDGRPAEARDPLAGVRGPLDFSDPAMRDFVADARTRGHDYLLIVRSLVDGRVEDYGINGRWPLSGILWITVALGALVPEHTFESRATLHVSMRDLYTGEEVYQTVLSGGPVELALINRGSVWGVISSIIIPPFLVWNDEENVREHVRDVARRRLLFSLARDMKGPACRQALASEAPARFSVATDESGTQVRINSRDALSFVQLRAQGDVVLPDSLRAVETALMDSQTESGDGLVYTARADWPTTGWRLQVVVQTVAGDAASATFIVEEGR